MNARQTAPRPKGTPVELVYKYRELKDQGMKGHEIRAAMRLGGSRFSRVIDKSNYMIEKGIE